MVRGVNRSHQAADVHSRNKKTKTGIEGAKFRGRVVMASPSKMSLINRVKKSVQTPLTQKIESVAKSIKQARK
jgi:hypothetical protein